MKAKMTPGPWTAERNHVYSDNGGHHVAFTEPANVSSEADTRAIACLPELVEAARAIMTSPADSISANGKAIAAFQALRRILARIDGGDNGNL